METKTVTLPPGDNTAGRRAYGTLRVRAAMEHVQEAQIQLSCAMRDLASVIGYIPEVDRLDRLYTKIRAEWYRIDEKVGRRPPYRHHIGELDRDPTERDADPHRNGCGHGSPR